MHSGGFFAIRGPVKVSLCDQGIASLVQSISLLKMGMSPSGWVGVAVGGWGCGGGLGWVVGWGRVGGLGLGVGGLGLGVGGLGLGVGGWDGVVGVVGGNT